MSQSVSNGVEELISSQFDDLKDKPTEELLATVASWIENELSLEGMYSGSPVERFSEWLTSGLLPQLKKLGGHGQATWDMLCDPSSAMSKERVASIVLTLSIVAGLQQLDVSTAVAIIVFSNPQQIASE